MAAGPSSGVWALEVASLRVRGQPLQPLDRYHPRTLEALYNHLPDQLQREALRRAMEEDEDDDFWRLDDEDSGDPEWDEMNRALRAGIDPATLPSWKGDDNG